MPTLSAYKAFLAVLDAGSVSGAARVLGAPRPTLSRRLHELEGHLGVRLLHRSPAGVQPTRAGEVLADQLRPWLRALRDAEATVRRMDDVPRGLLRVSAPPPIVSQLGPLLADYLARCPEVEVEVLSAQRFVDLRVDQIDVAIRGGTLRDPSMVTRRLRALDVLAVASPSFVAQRGPFTEARQLERVPCLRAHDPNGHSQGRWPLRAGGHVKVSGPLMTNDRVLLREAAVAGIGVALLTRAQATEQLAQGTLVEVLGDQVGAEVGLHAVYAEREFLPARVRLFVDAVVAWFHEEAP